MIISQCYHVSHITPRLAQLLCLRMFFCLPKVFSSVPFPQGVSSSVESPLKGEIVLSCQDRGRSPSPVTHHAPGSAHRPQLSRSTSSVVPSAVVSFPEPQPFSPPSERRLSHCSAASASIQPVWYSPSLGHSSPSLGHSSPQSRPVRSAAITSGFLVVRHVSRTAAVSTKSQSGFKTQCPRQISRSRHCLPFSGRT